MADYNGSDSDAICRPANLGSSTSGDQLFWADACQHHAIAIIKHLKSRPQFRLRTGPNLMYRSITMSSANRKKQHNSCETFHQPFCVCEKSALKSAVCCNLKQLRNSWQPMAAASTKRSSWIIIIKYISRRSFFTFTQYVACSRRLFAPFVYLFRNSFFFFRLSCYSSFCCSHPPVLHLYLNYESIVSLFI